MNANSPHPTHQVKVFTQPGFLGKFADMSSRSNIMSKQYHLSWRSSIADFFGFMSISAAFAGEYTS
jgi:hypothetical protein